MNHKKSMTIIIVQAIMIVAITYVGCKVLLAEPLDKGMEWGEESATVNESVDSTKLEMLDNPGYEYEPTEHDQKMQKMIEERNNKQ